MAGLTLRPVAAGVFDALGGSQRDLFGFAARLQDLVEGLGMSSG